MRTVAQSIAEAHHALAALSDATTAAEARQSEGLARGNPVENLGEVLDAATAGVDEFVARLIVLADHAHAAAQTAALAGNVGNPLQIHR